MEMEKEQQEQQQQESKKEEMSSSPAENAPEPQPDRIDQILAHLNSEDSSLPLPDHLRRKAEPESLAELEATLTNHPFFITQSQIDALSPSEPLPPLLDAFQQLKYSPDENTPLELAKNYKSDAMFQYKHGKYRIAATIFSEAIKHAEAHGEDLELLANLYNNRGVCQYYIENYGSGLKDFTKALSFKPDYVKSWRKGVECCLKLGKAADGLKILEKGLKLGMKDEWEMERRLKLGLKQDSLTKVKKIAAQKVIKKEHQVILEKISKSGVKMLNKNFLEVENTEAVVSISEEGNLIWPVLFYYPEHSTSDFIKAFDEGESFLPHLQEILDKDRPHWDKNGDYTSDAVSVHYVDGVKGGWVRVQNEDKLCDVMRQERYSLPTNGVPGFFILSSNEFCQFFLERMGNAND